MMKRAFLFSMIPILLSSCYDEEIFIEPSGKIKKVTVHHEGQNILLEYAYFYNGLEQLAKKVVSQDGKENGEIVFEYNDNGLLIKEENLIPNYHKIIVNTYDEEGKLISQLAGSSSFDAFYDSLDRLVSKKYYSIGGKKYNNEVAFEYDLEFPDQLKYERYLRHDGDEVYEYVYDQDGRLEYKQLIDGPDWLIRGPKESFVYDNTGRLYNKVTYELNIYWYTGVDNTETYYYFE